MSGDPKFLDAPYKKGQWQKKNPIAIPEIGEIPSESYSHLGRYAGAMVMACFEQMGGLPKFVEWASENPNDFYTKLYPKMISATKQVEVNSNVTLDTAIDKLDALKVIDVEVRENE